MKNHFSLLLQIQHSNVVSSSKGLCVKTTFDVLEASSYLHVWASGIKWGPLTNLFPSPLQEQNSSGWNMLRRSWGSGTSFIAMPLVTGGCSFTPRADLNLPSNRMLLLMVTVTCGNISSGCLGPLSYRNITV